MLLSHCVSCWQMKSFIPKDGPKTQSCHRKLLIQKVYWLSQRVPYTGCAQPKYIIHLRKTKENKHTSDSNEIEFYLRVINCVCSSFLIYENTSFWSGSLQMFVLQGRETQLSFRQWNPKQKHEKQTCHTYRIWETVAKWDVLTVLVFDVKVSNKSPSQAFMCCLVLVSFLIVSRILFYREAAEIQLEKQYILCI